MTFKDPILRRGKNNGSLNIARFVQPEGRFNAYKRSNSYSEDLKRRCPLGYRALKVPREELGNEPEDFAQ